VGGRGSWPQGPAAPTHRRDRVIEKTLVKNRRDKSGAEAGSPLDHVNGLLTAEGTPAFPNAEVLVPATEWKFWMDDGEMSRATGARMTGPFKNNRNIFEAGLKKKVTPYEWGKEVAPGRSRSRPSAILRGIPPTCCLPDRARSSSSRM
jgi:hypothetical protein